MPKQLYLAYLNTLTFSCVQMILYTTIPYIAEKTGVVTANIIAAISVGSLIFSFMGPFWAAKSDKLGRKKVLSFGMFGMAISFFLLASLFLFNDYLSLTIKIIFIYLSRIFYGLLCSAIVPVSQAWQLDLIGEEDHLKVLTKNSMCLNLGRILGPILILVKQVNFEFVIYCASVWVSILSLSVFLSSSNTKKFYDSSKDNISFKKLLSRWKLSINESLLPILLAMIFTSFIGILHSFLGSHLKSVLHITGQEATIMFAKIILVLSVLAIIFQQLSIVVFKSNWVPRVLIGSVSIVIGTWLMMIAKNKSLIWISIFIISISTALIPPAYLALTSKSNENNEKTNVFGKKLGLASIAHSLGYAIGAGLIAISMKLNILAESTVVIFISFIILYISFLLILKSRNSYVRS